MDVGRRSKARIGVVAGSVWESRMKLDEVRGGIKVFNGEENSEENGDNIGNNADDLQDPRNLIPKQNLVGASGKRKTWKSERFEGFDKNPIQIARQRSESAKSLECNDLSESVDGIKKNPIPTKKTRPEVGQELSVSADGIEKSPTKAMKTRTISVKVSSDSSDGILSRKVKSESNKALDEYSDVNDRNSELSTVMSEGSTSLDEPANGNEENSVELMKAKSVSIKTLGESGKSLSGLANGIKKSSVELKKAKLEANKVVGETNKGPEGSSERIENGSSENCKEFGVCEEKVVVTSNLGNVVQVKSPAEMVVTSDKKDGVEEEDWGEELEEEVDEEIEVEVEKMSPDVKEISISEQTPKKTVIEEKKFHQTNEKPVPISPNVKKYLPIAKFQPINEKPAPVSPSRISKSQQNGEKSVPKSLIVRKQPTSGVNCPKSQPNPTKNMPVSVSNDFLRIPRTYNKLQSLVELIMWRDISRTAFVFGIGTFLIISSSYIKDFNISFISVVSYLGLVYLAAIFIFRSVICRGAIDIDNTSKDYVVGEEEAVWLLKFVLPYLNEFFFKLRALFSGDPATTMRLAVFLFILARGGCSITIWKLAKLSFFGVFIVPKVCSSYSAQLTAYGKFWIQRFQDAWELCSHKKAVAFGIFTLVWNLSSIVARIWAVFMLFVAFRYYQQSLMREDLVEEATIGRGDAWQGQTGRDKQGLGDATKQKKRC